MNQRFRCRVRTSSSVSYLNAKADPIREASGVRPSLHPVVINALADVLKMRAQKKAPLEVTAEVDAVQVAMAASGIAAEAVAKRQQTSNQDDMLLTTEEEKTVVGRIVGVTMRLRELESILYEQCKSTSWIGKYNEWGSFGTLQDESSEDGVNERIIMDPLFTMSRAECLLAIFLKTIEAPQLEEAEMSVPDKSLVDFLDEDRKEVLLGN